MKTGTLKITYAEKLVDGYPVDDHGGEGTVTFQIQRDELTAGDKAVVSIPGREDLSGNYSLGGIIAGIVSLLSDDDEEVILEVVPAGL